MLGCTPYSEDEEKVKLSDPQDYEEWLSEYAEEDKEI
jgi:hypothetical protein